MQQPNAPEARRGLITLAPRHVWTDQREVDDERGFGFVRMCADHPARPDRRTRETAADDHDPCHGDLVPVVEPGDTRVSVSPTSGHPRRSRVLPSAHRPYRQGVPGRVEALGDER